MQSIPWQLGKKNRTLTTAKRNEKKAKRLRATRCQRVASENFFN